MVLVKVVICPKRGVDRGSYWVTGGMRQVKKWGWRWRTLTESHFYPA
jgi:hypothetical protein